MRIVTSIVLCLILIPNLVIEAKAQPAPRTKSAASARNATSNSQRNQLKIEAPQPKKDSMLDISTMDLICGSMALFLITRELPEKLSERTPPSKQAIAARTLAYVMLALAWAAEKFTPLVIFPPQDPVSQRPK